MPGRPVVAQRVPGSFDGVADGVCVPVVDKQRLRGRFRSCPVRTPNPPDPGRPPRWMKCRHGLRSSRRPVIPACSNRVARGRDAATPTATQETERLARPALAGPRRRCAASAVRNRRRRDTPACAPRGPWASELSRRERAGGTRERAGRNVARARAEGDRRSSRARSTSARERSRRAYAFSAVRIAALVRRAVAPTSRLTSRRRGFLACDSGTASYPRGRRWLNQRPDWTRESRRKRRRGGSDG